MEDICNLIPPKNSTDSIDYYHFVYEANLKKLRQPFKYSNYYAHLVFKGNGILKTEGKEIQLIPGTLFFTFPQQSFEIESNNNITYFYISYNGMGTRKLLENFNITKENCVFNNFAHLLDFWMSSIRRISPTNSTTLTESVLLHTLSYINEVDEGTQKITDKFELIVDYINKNFADPNFSIGKVADIFFYNKKYLSTLFMKETSVKFTDYLNNVRIENAIRLINDNMTNVSEIAQKCGFSDPFYFSKVFKKVTNKTPTEFIKSIKQNSTK